MKHPDYKEYSFSIYNLTIYKQLIMKKNITIYIVSVLLAVSCTSPTPPYPHLGSKNILYKEIVFDSITFDASQTSGQGNFFMQDSIITFADSYFVTLFRFNCSDGSFIDKHFSSGKGPNLMNGFTFVYPFNNDEKNCYIVDNSLSMRTYHTTDWNLTTQKVIDFDWNKKDKDKDNYESPSNYNLMPMTEFNCSFTKIDDSLCFFPVSVMTRITSPNGVLDSEHYKKAHIFGLMNTKTMNVSKVFGNMPVIYQTKSVPHINFFDYTTNSDTIYVNFPIDSLIYVYKYPDTLLYTLGFECQNINRDYTETFDVTPGNKYLRIDSKKVGIISNIKYIPETGILFRTYIKNMLNQDYGLQIYENNDLIADINVPSSFKIIGYQAPYYYGVKSKPLETEEQTFFTFYKFHLK